MLTWVLCAAPTCLPYLTLICFSQSRGAATTVIPPVHVICTSAASSSGFFFRLAWRSTRAASPPAIHIYTCTRSRDEGLGPWRDPCCPCSPEPSDGLHTGDVSSGLAMAGGACSYHQLTSCPCVPAMPAARLPQRPCSSRIAFEDGQAPALHASVLLSGTPPSCTPITPTLTP